MKRNLAIIIAVGLIISGSGTVTSSFTDEKFVEKTEEVSFSSAQFLENNDYTNIDLYEATSYLTTPGSYMLPVVTRVYTFPFKTTITDVTVSYTETEEKIISKPVQLAPQPMKDNTLEPIHAAIQMKSWNIYPEQPFSYHIAAGRDGANLVTYLAVHLYPIQYLPSENTIRYSKNAQIIITSIPPETKTTTADQYELIIIAPEAFSKELQPLVTHKISKDMTTKLVTQEDISNSVYFTKEGRDSAEEMK